MSKDSIINSLLRIKLFLDEVLEEEQSLSKGTLSVYYKEINEILDYLIRERLLELVKRYCEYEKK